VIRDQDHRLRRPPTDNLWVDPRARVYIRRPVNEPRQPASPRDRTGQVLGPYRVVRLLGAGGMGRVYLAEDTSDGRHVALKVLNDDIVRDRTARVRFLREAQSASAVQHVSVAGVYAIHEVDDAVFIAMEYVEGQTLRAFLDAQRRPLELREALRIARDVAHALCHAHAAGVVHRDLKPENLMLDPRGQVKVLDFGLAKQAGAPLDGGVENASTLNFATADGIILGTPSYMAPEQIHGKPTDARADIFSVGVVLYEMAAGVRPFRGASTMEVLIATARDELSPASAHNPAVPAALDVLLARCLAKAPEDRHASAEDLAAELDELLLAEVEVELQGAVPGTTRGYPGEILPPRFLRGRELEIDALQGATARAREGGTHLVLVHGEPGVGKTALLSSLRDPVNRGGGRFVSGKFDRNAQGAPLAPLAQALSALVRQISGAPDAERWRIDLADATGPNRHVLDDMVPELRRLLGPAPEAPADAAEAKNRFHAAFQRIIRLFAARSPPLVLALDDLHCADPAALHLIELILSDPAGGHLLVLASFRDAELDDAHPLRLTQDRLRRLGVVVHEIALAPLHGDEVTQLVADALGCDPELAAPLALRLDQHASGNPAMLRHQLLGLRREGHLTFDSGAARWRWDDTTPLTSDGPTNVAGFVTARLQRLPAGVQRVLAIAALAGRPIDLTLLSAVDRRGPLATTADLREAVSEGLLVPSDTALHTLQQNPSSAPPGSSRATYQPLHDGIAQASAVLLPRDDRAEIHLQLGRNLLRQQNPDDDDLFALVDHLDRGLMHMTDPAERERLARLHLEACRRARIATAYAAAVRHARAGLVTLATLVGEADAPGLVSGSDLALVPDILWQRYPDHTFKLQREWMHAEALRGELDAADALFDPLVRHAVSELHRADLYRLKAQLDTYHGRPHDAMAAGLAGLYRLGVEMLPRPEPAEIEAEYDALAQILGTLGTLGILARIAGPVCTDPRIVAITELMSAVGPAAMFADTRLAYHVFIRLVRLFVDHGPTRDTAYGLAGYGLYLAGARRESARAFEFGQYALQMRDRFADPTLGARILHIVGGLITGWTQPFAVAAATLEQGYAIGVQTGDFAAATYNTTTLVLVLVARRHSLTAVRATAEQLLVEARPMLEVYGSSIISCAIRMCRCLAGELTEPTPGSVDRWLAEVFLREFERDVSPLTLLYVHIYTLCTLYHFGIHDPAELPRLPASAAERLGALVTPMAVDYFFYNALHACAAPTTTPESRAAIASDLAELRKLAVTCPANFEARGHLVAAEYERLCGRYDAAESAFKLAIRAARKQGEAGTEALACELAGRHAANLGDDIVGTMYLRAAVEAYQRWGAHTVARRLAATHSLDIKPGN